MSPALSTALRRVRLSVLVLHAAGIILATYLSGPSLLSGESLRGSNTGEEEQLRQPRLRAPPALLL